MLSLVHAGNCGDPNDAGVRRSLLRRGIHYGAPPTAGGISLDSNSTIALAATRCARSLG
ncbi:MAG: hypothetical protein GY826_06795 [Fuerstiella sp.]|nr:hypothetical protein [Fuerstiella sp.]